MDGRQAIIVRRGPRFAAALAYAAVVLAGAACTSEPEATGTLTGHVSIGPLVPVVREGVPEPTPAPEVFAGRQIVVFSGDGRREIVRVSIDGQGNYRVDLPVGRYQVDINHAGIDSAAGLPAEVEIHAGKITRIDVDIDTGIR